ncbi:helix-turn-helix transcriptional regulator [Mucilaginibacter sp. OK098]|uniref:helix-turn-helix transcriptional regulator n=1 Tax=Mucilaginibacter sp. OK098 TaxID=1855297 RepID=UPI000933D55F|nr:helix-turn-helix transcriptional regulator [Mucilaginibacter sp. OK098]
MDKETELKRLGRHIQELRKSKGLTQTQLAHSIGKDQQSIQRLEMGDFNPTYYYLTEIAQGLGVTVEELVRV